MTVYDALNATLDAIDGEYHRLAPNQMSDSWYQFEPATDEDIERLEEKLELELPAEYRAFLLTNTTRHPFSANFECLDYDGVVRAWELMTDLLDDGTFEGYVENRRGAENWADGVIREVWWSRQWVPISADSVGNLMCIDLDPGENGRVGQIMNMEVQDGQGPYSTRYDSFASYLAAHLAHLRFGQHRVMDEWLEVDEYEKAELPETGGPDRILTYRLADLPAELALDLPADAGPRDCLFWLAREGSPIIEALMEAVPEPDMDHTAEGMSVAGRVAMVAARGRKTARVLRPEDVTRREEAYGGTYSLGFHTAPTAEVEAFFAEADCIVEPLGPLLDELLILYVTNDAGEPVGGADLMKNGERVPTVGIGDGFFVREVPAPFYGPFVVEAEGREASVECLPPGGFLTVVV